MILPRRVRQLLQAEEGTAMIEFSLLLPLLVVLLIGTINYTIFLEQQMVLTHGAATGAAYASLPGKSSDKAGIQTAVLAAMPTLQQATTTSSTYWTCTPGGSHVASQSTCSDGKTPHQWVEVELSAKAPAVFVITGLDSVLTLHASVINPVPWSP